MKMSMLLLSGLFLAMFLFGCTLQSPPVPNRTNNTTNQGCICTLEYNPVCGTDGKTYGNACAARCAKVETAYPGECRSCNDTDANDILTKGTATDNSGEHPDTCAGASAVTESYCDYGTAKSQDIDCAADYECKDGACVKKTAPPPVMACEEYCPAQPHIECVGTWNISGTYPDCNCGFVCKVNETKIPKSTLRLFSGLTPPDNGHYELWAVSGTKWTSIGRFEFGNDLKFDSQVDLSKAQGIAVTIEPEGDSDSIPGILYLWGEINGSKADLSFAADFSKVNGSYVLLEGTPTGNSHGEVSGIWFMTAAEPRHASLNLPALPQGWVYEGWVVYKGMLLSTGRFSSATGVDKSGYYSGSGAAPPFPGEDFLNNAPEGLPFPARLTDGSTKIMISVEPDWNGTDPTGPGPFFIKPLMAEIEDDFISGEDHLLDLSIQSMPPVAEVTVDSKAGDKISCVEFCPIQPHDSCIGSWSISGDYAPDCICDYNCRPPTG